MQSPLSWLAVVLLVTPSAHALERAERAWVDEERATVWRSGCTSAIVYWNVCTGWAWTWTGFDPHETVGVHYSRSPYEVCDVGPNGLLHASWLYTSPGAPPGYGFTGAVEVRAATPGGCLVGPPVATQPFLPLAGWSLQTWTWVVAPPEFAVTYTLGGAPGNPVGFVTDHPAASPTGPPALGLCYPADRENHSYRYGPASAPPCPGIPFLDPAGAAQLLHEVEGYVHEWYPPVSVEATTWGRVKGMYR